MRLGPGRELVVQVIKGHWGWSRESLSGRGVVIMGGNAGDFVKELFVDEPQVELVVGSHDEVSGIDVSFRRCASGEIFGGISYSAEKNSGYGIVGIVLPGWVKWLGMRPHHVGSCT
eukprot:8093142-Ditylum_brightwellii.AAC.1